jgi:squalene-hopene/tetraprenyl-beta-curcumene cyclase
MTRESATTHPQRLLAAVARTRDWLKQQQHPEGFWVGELEGDTILESEYILLLAYLGQGQSATALKCAAYIREKQTSGGGWAIYPGGPLELSASVKAYWTLKIAGDSPDAPHMVRAREAIRAAGGAEQVNSFTRYYFALLGIISYEKCPAVPPEVMLLPTWCPFNIYEMSAWSRTILVPLSLLWAFRPQFQLPEQHQIRELFLRSPEELPVSMGESAVLDPLKKRTLINWSKLFRGLDLVIKTCERVGFKPLRARSIRLAADWMMARFADSDGLGAIFPPIIWSIVGLKCLGHSDDSPLVLRALNELEKLTIHENKTARLEPCKSPVWDTAIATIALRDAGLAANDPTITRSVKWLLSKEVREDGGDWHVRRPDVPSSGWYFEFNNRFYPDVDDTSMVLIALTRALPEHLTAQGRAEFLFGRSDDGLTGTPVGAVLAGQNVSAEQALADLQNVQPMLDAMRRGARWISEMQNRDGGWGAFDNNNDREILTRVPFADHNAMIDPSTADLTSRNLEMYAGLGMAADHPVAVRALDFLWKNQEADHCWFGRWGVNYLYGTWQTLVGLMAIGVPQNDPRVRRAVAWLKMHQQESGGWGETPESYDDPALRGQGTPTASQTAWALLGLLAAGEANSAAVDAGVQYLLDTQRDDGTWTEEEFTGTGFPRVFYLRYHMYRIYFPLMALARVSRLRHGEPAATMQWTV